MTNLKNERWPVFNRITVALLGLLLLAGLVLFAFRDSVSELLFYWTGEEESLQQVVATYQLAGNLLRPRPETQPYLPVAHAGVNPFGVNTFLQEEVEEAKRERILQMVNAAGFRWIRQEFPWEDIEINGKGDFEDRRHDPPRSAWDKYDNMVDLAERYNLEIIARLSNPPAWSRVAGNDLGTMAPPDDYDDYGDFVYAVVSRYKGRLHYYQIWNEPNIYPEWGEQAVDAAQYTELLKTGYTRAKEADPQAVILSGALASTIELGPRDVSDFLFLQQMYDNGARDYFDVLTMQGYGLWSGPHDRRMRPRVLNFSRPIYVRDIMIKNGDAHKPLWLTEMNWNALPPDHAAYPQYGRVTEEQQARYVVEAYRRVQEEWPWMGVVNFWFFKRATDAEQDQAMYYFRMVEPDFTPLPVYEALREYANSLPIMYRGYHQEDHWTVDYEGDWQTVADAEAVLGAYRESRTAGEGLSFIFQGTDLSLVVVKDERGGILEVVLDGLPPVEIDLTSPTPQYGVEVSVARALPHRTHRVWITVKGPQNGEDFHAGIDGFIVRCNSGYAIGRLLAGLVVIGVSLGLVYVFWGRGERERREFSGQAGDTVLDE